MEWENTDEYEGSIEQDRIMATRTLMRSAMLQELPGVAAQVVQQHPGLLRVSATVPPECSIVHPRHQLQRTLRFRVRRINSSTVGGLALLPHGHIAGMWYLRSPRNLIVPRADPNRLHEGTNETILNLGHQYWIEDGLTGVISAIPWDEGITTRGCVVLTSTFGGLTPPEGFHVRLVNWQREDVFVRQGEVVAILYFMRLTRPQVMEVDHCAEMVPRDCWRTPRTQGPRTPPGTPPRSPTETIMDLPLSRTSTPLSVGRESPTQSVPPMKPPASVGNAGGVGLNPDAQSFVPRRSESRSAPSAPPSATGLGSTGTVRLSSRFPARHSPTRHPLGTHQEEEPSLRWETTATTSSGSRTDGPTATQPERPSSPPQEELRTTEVAVTQQVPNEPRGEKEKHPAK